MAIFAPDERLPSSTTLTVCAGKFTQEGNSSLPLAIRVIMVMIVTTAMIMRLWWWWINDDDDDDDDDEWLCREICTEAGKRLCKSWSGAVICQNQPILKRRPFFKLFNIEEWMNEWTFDSGRISIFNSRHAECRKFICEKVWRILVLKNAAKEFKNSKNSHRIRKEEKEGKCGFKDNGSRQEENYSLLQVT